MKLKLNALWIREELFWKQRSTFTWLAHGDRNTSYFHRTTLSRMQRNKLVRLKDVDGRCVLGEKEIMLEIHGFYSNLFRLDRDRLGEDMDMEDVLRHVPKQITDIMNESLTKVATTEEVKRDTCQMGESRAPGSDGFSGYSFQRKWDAIDPDIVTSVNAFLSTCTMPSFLNQTDITLMPSLYYCGF